MAFVIVEGSQEPSVGRDNSMFFYNLINVYLDLKKNNNLEEMSFNGKRHIVTIKYKRFLVNNIFE